MEPFFEDFEGDDPVSFVVSLNLHRRHLNESQRAMVAAKIATLPRGANQHTQDRPIGRSTQSDAASVLSVGERSVRRAREVLEKGTHDLVQAVERGSLAVSAAAEVARMPPERQREVLERADLSKSGNVRALLASS